MTAERIKRWIKNLFYVPKYAKISDQSFSRIMLSSVFGILICGMCLAGLTWAWFSSSVTSTANNITSAKFSVDIRVIPNRTDTPLSPTEENGNYILDSGTYTVTVTAQGSATAGFCTVEFDGKTYHTVPLFTDTESESHSVTFTVTSTSDNSPLTIIPQWGTYAKNGETLVGNKDGNKDGNKEPYIAAIPVSTLQLSGVYAVDPEPTETVQQSNTPSKAAASSSPSTVTENAATESSSSESQQPAENSSSEETASHAAASESGAASETQSRSEPDTTESTTEP